jgi:hypothetical protein
MSEHRTRQRRLWNKASEQIPQKRGIGHLLPTPKTAETIEYVVDTGQDMYVAMESQTVKYRNDSMSSTGHREWLRTRGNEYSVHES